jgi:NAD+ synthase
MAKDTLRLAIAQLNPVVGDIAGNATIVRRARAEAAKQKADLVIFTELFISGYPPEDLVLKPAFQAACRAAVEELARETKDGGPAILIGTPWPEGGKLYNANALLDGGKIAGLRFKMDLPNYGVFDEKRVFHTGPMPGPVNFRGIRIGIPVCEDIWSAEAVECISETGGEILLVTNASPYRRGVMMERLNVAVPRVVESGLPLVYANQVGGQDELVFEGASFGLNADRSLAFQIGGFKEEIALTEWKRENGTWKCVSGPRETLLETDEADYNACMLGLRDYVNKNGFPGVVLGMSGGIDSALCAAIAADALGPSRVYAVMLPYKYTAKDSFADAEACAKALQVRYDTIPIAPAVEGLEAALASTFKGQKRDITEENIQSRARGTILMSISNKFGPMVVTTGNKSEMSVGYATLYGDMNGGFNPIKDLYKTEVYRLAALRNRWKPESALGPPGKVIPENILTKAPTAELRENQKDQDSLPPYDVLDAILARLVEGEDSVAAIAADGFDLDTVKRVERLLNLAEYKRRQAAPGVKVTLKNFGRDRRYPIVNKFRDSGTPSAKPDNSLVAGAVPTKSEAVDF